MDPFFGTGSGRPVPPAPPAPPAAPQPPPAAPPRPGTHNGQQVMEDPLVAEFRAMQMGADDLPPRQGTQNGRSTAVDPIVAQFRALQNATTSAGTRRPEQAQEDPYTAQIRAMQMEGTDAGRRGINMQNTKRPVTPVPVSYKGYTLVKTALRRGDRARWAHEPLRTRMDRESDELERQIAHKWAQTRKSVLDDYKGLPSDNQRKRIDELLQDCRAKEDRTDVEWQLASIESDQKKMKNGNMETTAMHVVLKRQPTAEAVAAHEAHIRMEEQKRRADLLQANALKQQREQTAAAQAKDSYQAILDRLNATKSNNSKQLHPNMFPEYGMPQQSKPKQPQPQSDVEFQNMLNQLNQLNHQSNGLPPELQPQKAPKIVQQKQQQPLSDLEGYFAQMNNQNNGLPSEFFQQQSQKPQKKYPPGMVPNDLGAAMFPNANYQAAPPAASKPKKGHQQPPMGVDPLNMLFNPQMQPQVVPDKMPPHQPMTKGTPMMPQMPGMDPFASMPAGPQLGGKATNMPTSMPGPMPGMFPESQPQPQQKSAKKKSDIHQQQQQQQKQGLPGMYPFPGQQPANLQGLNMPYFPVEPGMQGQSQRNVQAQPQMPPVPPPPPPPPHPPFAQAGPSMRRGPTPADPAIFPSDYSTSDDDDSDRIVSVIDESKKKKKTKAGMSEGKDKTVKKAKKVESTDKVQSRREALDEAIMDDPTMQELLHELRKNPSKPEVLPRKSSLKQPKKSASREFRVREKVEEWHDRQRRSATESDSEREGAVFSVAGNSDVTPPSSPGRKLGEFEARRKRRGSLQSRTSLAEDDRPRRERDSKTYREHQKPEPRRSMTETELQPDRPGYRRSYTNRDSYGRTPVDLIPESSIYGARPEPRRRYSVVDEPRSLTSTRAPKILQQFITADDVDYSEDLISKSRRTSSNYLTRPPAPEISEYILDGIKAADYMKRREEDAYRRRQAELMEIELDRARELREAELERELDRRELLRRLSKADRDDKRSYTAGGGYYDDGYRRY